MAFSLTTSTSLAYLYATGFFFFLANYAFFLLEVFLFSVIAFSFLFYSWFKFVAPWFQTQYWTKHIQTYEKVWFNCDLKWTSTKTFLVMILFVYFPVIAVQTWVCCEKAIIGLRLSFVIQWVVCLTVH